MYFCYIEWMTRLSYMIWIPFSHFLVHLSNMFIKRYRMTDNLKNTFTGNFQFFLKMWLDSQNKFSCLKYIYEVSQILSFGHLSVIDCPALLQICIQLKYQLDFIPKIKVQQFFSNRLRTYYNLSQCEGACFNWL